MRLAEFVGIMPGDGPTGVYPGHYRLKTSLISDDLQHSNYVRDLIKKELGKEIILDYRKNENKLDLLIFKREIIRDLLEMCLVKKVR